MFYYQVMRQFTAHGSYNSYEFIKDELITERELHKICRICGFHELKLIQWKQCMKLIDIPKNRTFWFFGCRFY